MSAFNRSILQKRLRSLRSDHRLTQAKAAELFDVSRTCYSSWELGQSCPPIEDLYTICCYYNVSSDYLLGLSDIQQSSSPLNVAPLSVPRDYMAGLTDDQREIIKSTISTMLTQNERNSGKQEA